MTATFMVCYLRLTLLIIPVLSFFNCLAQSPACCSDYEVQLTLLPETDSIDLADLYWSTADKVNELSKSDTLFTLAIENKGRKNISMSPIPVITYEDEPSGYGSDLFFHLWFRDKEGTYIVFNSKSADIDFIEDPTQASAENTIAPGKKRRINRRMNPFRLHGDRGPGHYRLQVFYRYATPDGDYITKSNLTYIKVTNHKPLPESEQEQK